MMHTKRIFTLDTIAAIVALQPCVLSAGPTTLANPPSECSAPNSTCGCSEDGDYGARNDGTGGERGGNDGDGVENGCIKVRLGLGRTTPWTGSLACSLKILADDDAPEIFTSESLHAVLGGYTFKRLGQRTMSNGVTPAEVVFSHPNGESVTFAFAEGESWGRPDPGVHRDMDERLMMADAEGWATTSDPVYYDLYVGDGTRRRFLATDATGRRGALVSITDARGVTNTPEEMGVDIVYDINGVRQFLTPSRLADVTHTPDWSGYDVAVYALGDILPAKDPATGLYALPPGNPSKRLSVRRADGGKRAVVTILRGGSDPLVSVYDYAMGDWSLTRPSGVREEKERMIADSRAARIVSTVREPSGDRLSRRESNYQWMSWGFAMTNRIEGFSGVTETTAWTYHESGNGRGQVATEHRQSGLLVQYAYDALDRIVTETRSGPGMMTQTTTYAYVSVDSADVVPPVDKRPRTVVRTLDGIECERTYYVYSPLTNVVERVGAQGAAYGGTNALRTVTAYWPVFDNDIRSGFVASIRRENGALDFYDYALASNLWTRTVTHLHELSPEPVDGRTTRDIMVTNRRGETVETRTEAYVEGAWRVVARSQRSFNAEGRIVRREDLAGQITTTVWDCCHKVSETQPDGSVTTWDYDVEGRMTASSKLIPLDMTNMTWLTTCHEYDGLGRQTATWQTNRIAGIGTPPERNLRDPLGRIASRTDARGAVTRFSYAENASGSMRTEIRADGTDLASTNTVQLLPDGRTLSRFFNGVRREHHVYAPLSSTTYSGPGGADSPRWTRTDRDLLGRVVSTTHPGFGGSTLVSSNRYDTAGRLVEMAEYALAVPQGGNGQNATTTLLSRTLLTYDPEGNEVLRIEDRDRDGAINLAGADFAVSNVVSLVLHDDALWRRTGTYATVADGSPDFHFLGATETRLTGFSVMDDPGIGQARLVAESAVFDSLGNVSTNRVLVQSGNAFVLKESISPTSVQTDREVLHHGYPVSRVSSTAVSTIYAYDGLGRISAATDGRGNTTVREYTPAGDLARIVDAAGNATEYAHDILGRRIAETDPLGHAVHRAYDAENHVVGEWGATYPAAYEYDAWGSRTALYTYRGTNDIASAANLLALKPSMDRTRWLHDEATGLVTNKLYADGKGPTYSYTPDGHPLRRVWARGVATDYAYDETGTLSSIAYSDDTPSVAYARDRLGRVVRAVVEGVSTNEYAYSLSGLLTNEVQNGVILSRTYDDFSRPTGYALETGGAGGSPADNGSSVIYSYDNLGRFASVASGTNVFTYTRLPGTDLVTGYSCGPFRRAVTFEPQRDLIATVTNSFGDRLISAFDYVNDAAGRRISRRDTRENEVIENVFGYNLRSELTSAQMGTNSYEYAYDPIGNRTYTIENGVRADYVANELNQYTEIQSGGELKQLAYDEDGNTTFDGRFRYTWDGENRMIFLTPTQPMEGVHKIQNVYDDISRRTRMIFHVFNTNSWVKHGSSTFLYDQWNIVSEMISTNACNPFDRVNTVWGLDLSGSIHFLGGVGGLLQTESSQGEFSFPAYDANGNVTDYFNCTERASTHMDYDIVGVQRRNHRISVARPFLYSTKRADGENGWVDFGMRYYDPFLGRWSARDTIELRNLDEPYTFVKNNSVNFVDVLGNSEWGPNYGIGSPTNPYDFGIGIPIGMPTDFATPWLYTPPTACCNGVEYHPRTHCCRDGQVFSYAAIDSGIRLKCWYEHNYIILSKGFALIAPDHCWLETPQKALGFWPGGVQSEPIYPTYNSIDNPNGFLVTKSIIGSLCYYDFDAIAKCIEDSKNLLPYFLPFHDCRHWSLVTFTKCKLKGIRTPENL